MELTNGKAVETWTADDVAKAAKEMGLTLSSKEKKAVLERMCKEYSKENGWSNAKTMSLVRSMFGSEGGKTDETPKPNSSTAVDAKSFKWHFHASGKNETKAAVATALDANRPLLIYAGKPGCSVCELAWKNYLKAETKLADWMRDNAIVGLKIDDSASHFTDLGKFKNKWTGIDGASGKKTNSTAPFLVFVKLSEKARGKTKITLDPSKNELDAYLSGFGGAKATDKTYEAIAKWLTGVMGLEEFKKLFK